MSSYKSSATSDEMIEMKSSIPTNSSATAQNMCSATLNATLLETPEKKSCVNSSSTPEGKSRATSDKIPEVKCRATRSSSSADSSSTPENKPRIHASATLSSTTLYTACELAFTSDGSDQPTSTKRPASTSTDEMTPKKQRISLIQDTLEKGVNDMDLHMTSALYHVSKGDAIEATRIMEKVRRLLKCQTRKCSELLKDVGLELCAKMQTIASLNQRELHLHRTTLALESKIDGLEKKITDLVEEREFRREDDDFLTSLSDLDSSVEKHIL